MKYDENSTYEQLNDVFKDMIEAQAKIATIKPTYCNELCYKMCRGIKDIAEIVESYCIVNGVQAIIKDKRDGQEYVVTITPKDLFDKKK